MKEFPILKNNQVAIMRAQLSTGYIFDINFNLVLNEQQEVYSIYNSIDEALIMVREELGKRKNIEFVIYDSGENVLSYLK